MQRVFNNELTFKISFKKEFTTEQLEKISLIEI